MNQTIPHFKILENDQVRVSRLEEKHVSKYFPTHRHKYYELVIITACVEGDYSHNIDFITYPLQAGRIYFIAPGQAHAWNIKTYNKEYKGFLVTFNEDFILNGNKALERELLKLFDPLDTEPYIDFEPNAFSTIFPTMPILEQEYLKKTSNYALLRSLLESLLHYMSALKLDKHETLDFNCQRLVDVRKLIEKYYKEERHVDFYARKMDLSAKRLNEIARELSGQTITQLIHRRLLLEAKREIISQTKTIHTVSDELGFENPSYFSRFFKKHEGISPSEFLKQVFK